MAVLDSTKKANFKHGLYKTREYRTYADIKTRCYNPNYSAFKYYGGRGIKMCDRWLIGENGKQGFLCFLEDMGKRPGSHYSIERADNYGNYEPKNCRWATKTEQSENKRSAHLITINGRTENLSVWAKEMNIKVGTVLSRIIEGWSPQDAVLTPLRSARERRTNRLINLHGKTQSVYEWSKQSGISPDNIRRRIKCGWDVEKAIFEPLK